MFDGGDLAAAADRPHSSRGGVMKSERHSHLIMALLVAAATVAVTTAAAARDFSDEVRAFIAEDAPVILIRDVRIVDGTGAAAIDGQDILLAGGRIAAIGATGTLDAPGDARILPLPGRTVLPGLVMLHEHLYYTSNDSDHFMVTQQSVMFPRLYLAAGVTTARTAGSVEPYTDLNVKREIDAGRLAGPDFDITGPYLEGAPAAVLQLYPLRSAREARDLVAYWANLGATSFKAYMNITREALGAAIDEAHKRGLKVAGHICSVTFAEAAALGIDSLEHGFAEATDFYDWHQPDTCQRGPRRSQAFRELTPEDPGVVKLIRALVEANVAITSTLVVETRFNREYGWPPEGALDALDVTARAAFLERRARALANPEAVAARAQGTRVQMALQKAFFDAGGLLVAGSDTTGGGGTVAGYADHETIALLVAAGLSPLEAIRVATLNGAVYLGRAGRIGTVAVGKEADLMIVAGRPDEDIGDLAKVELVFKDGVAFDSAALFESARGTIGAPGN